MATIFDLLQTAINRAAKFTEHDPAGSYIPGSIETTIATGATIDLPNGLFGSLRTRYFGPRPLIEDNSVRSKATTLVNLEAGYKGYRARSCSCHAGVVYANGSAQRVLTQRSPEQEELFVALNLRPLAEQLGNTVLEL